MKITKRQLKRIIREAILLKESGHDSGIEEQINKLMEEWIAANPGASTQETMQEYYRIRTDMRRF